MKLKFIFSFLFLFPFMCQDAFAEEPKSMIFHESFEETFWFESWGLKQTPRNAQLISDPDAFGFVPLKGKALCLKVNKDGHYGTSFSFDFEEKWGKEPEAVFFRYYLRFGKDWKPHGGGKLPGISGTYGVAGWGGRPSHGNDGWSARGLFLKSESGRTPVGFYAYHADMTGKYGDNWVWQGSDQGGLKQDRWYCIKQFVSLNTPGNKDGVLKAWVDDALVFEKKNVQMRHIDRLKIESVWINLYYGGRWTAPSDMHVYIDDVVISNQKIGFIKN